MKHARMTTGAFNRLVRATKDFCSKNGHRITHQYIRLDFHAHNDSVVAVAVDGFRMSVEHAVAHCEEDFFVYVRSNVKLPAGKSVDIELADNEVIIRCDGFIFGYAQPSGDFFDWEKALPKTEQVFKIGFNGEYLLSALKAAKESVGNTFKDPIILEFRSPLEPVIIRTNRHDVKMVLPVRLKD